MRALVTAVIYFGTFLSVGLAVRLLIGRWHACPDVELGEILAQAGPRRRPRRMFLLGAWRTEE
jgi:hypothetical protein